jgi:NAD(P)-dependent dehydrogenase (short-subunit alcohol dehydrogenase family)
MAVVSEMSVSYDFSGKTAVVTGGSKGIGRAICEQLKQSGAQVWNWDMTPSSHDGVSFAQVDVVDGEQIDAAISKVGRIDILVNNAGLLGPPVSVELLQSGDWRRVLDVNLTSVFEVSRRVVPLMKQSGWGRIVNMASVAAKEGFTNLSAYSSASAGVVAFTKALGKELADTAIRVNVVAPAAVDTDLIRQF